MAPMKTFVVTPWYPSEKSPTSGTFIKQVASLVQSFAQVVVIHPLLDERFFFYVEKTSNEPVTYRVRYGGFLVAKWKFLQEKRRLNGFSALDIFSKKVLALFLFYVLFTLVTIMGVFAVTKIEGKPHVFHAHVYKISFPIILLSKALHVPVIMSIHASDFLTNKVSFVDYIVHVRTMSWCRCLLPVSTVLAEHLRKYHLPPEKIKIVPNPIMIDEQPPSSSDVEAVEKILPEKTSDTGNVVKMGVITNFYDVKGLEILFQSIRELISLDIRNFVVLIVGTGEHQERYVRFAKELGILKYVQFLGALPHWKVIAFLKKVIDFYVHPSLRETFGIALVEALACGKPVVATRTGVAPMVVTSVNGLLIPPNNVGALAEALRKMMTLHGTFHSEDIIRSVEKLFAPTIIAKELKKTYFKVLREHH